MRKRERKRRPERRVATWQISRLRGTPAAFIGLVDAPDAASAKERAIKQFAIRPEDQKRLIAVRHPWPARTCGDIGGSNFSFGCRPRDFPPILPVSIVVGLPVLGWVNVRSVPILTTVVSMGLIFVTNCWVTRHRRAISLPPDRGGTQAHRQAHQGAAAEGEQSSDWQDARRARRDGGELPEIRHLKSRTPIKTKPDNADKSALSGAAGGATAAKLLPAARRV
jgi:hypothetical protein